MKGYCLKCRTKQDMIDHMAVTVKGGRQATQGHCAVCNTKITRFGISDQAAPAHPPLRQSYRPVSAVLGVALGALGLLFTRRLLNKSSNSLRSRLLSKANFGGKARYS